MNGRGEPRRPWFLRIQSAYVLPLARGIYLFIALVTVIGGAGYAIYSQASIGSEPATLSLPLPYQGADMVAQPSDHSVRLAAIHSRLAPPTNIRFIVTAGTITTPVSEGQAILDGVSRQIRHGIPAELAHA